MPHKEHIDKASLSSGPLNRAIRAVSVTRDRDTLIHRFEPNLSEAPWLQRSLATKTVFHWNWIAI